MHQYLIRIHVPGNISFVSNKGIHIKLYKKHGEEAEIVNARAQ